MNDSMKLFAGLNYVSARYIDEALDCMTPTKDSRAAKRRRGLKSALIAAAIMAMLVALGAAAYALGNMWSKGLRQQLSATEAQQQQLQEAGLAAVFAAAEDGKPADTERAGVTITPQDIVADGERGIVTFVIDGFTLNAGEEPGIYHITAYYGDDAEAGRLNFSGGFSYTQPLDEAGNMIGKPVFTDEDGRMEFTLSFQIARQGASMCGERLHVRLEDLCADAQKATLTPVLRGVWEYDFTLPDTVETREVALDAAVDGTAFTVQRVKITPISIEVIYQVNGGVEITADEIGVPMFTGLILKSGERLENIISGGGEGYADEAHTAAYSRGGFSRVIAPEEVAGIILLRIKNGAFEYAEFPLPED